MYTAHTHTRPHATQKRLFSFVCFLVVPIWRIVSHKRTRTRSTLLPPRQCVVGWVGCVRVCVCLCVRTSTGVDPTRAPKDACASHPNPKGSLFIYTYIYIYIMETINKHKAFFRPSHTPPHAPVYTYIYIYIYTRLCVEGERRERKHACACFCSSTLRIWHARG